jgi:hypothetical protein
LASLWPVPLARCPSLWHNSFSSAETCPPSGLAWRPSTTRCGSLPVSAPPTLLVTLQLQIFNFLSIFSLALWPQVLFQAAPQIQASFVPLLTARTTSALVSLLQVLPPGLPVRCSQGGGVQHQACSSQPPAKTCFHCLTQWSLATLFIWLFSPTLHTQILSPSQVVSP